MRRHKSPVSGAAAALFVGMVALTGGLVWYQGEEAGRQAKNALAEAAIGQALDQGEQARAKLGAALKEPGGVFRLLNDPTRWRADIQAARGALDRAEALLRNSAEELDPELAQRAEDLRQLLARNEADRELAVALEKVRTDRADPVEGAFDFARAARDYSRTFTEAGFAVPADAPADVAAVAARLDASPIREQLVAALDDWAYVTWRKGEDATAGSLLEVARRAAPDPRWGDRLRRLELWRDRKALGQLVKEAPVTALSPQTLLLVGNLLNGDQPLWQTWLRRAQAQYPGDFWLNFELGSALIDATPAEAAGFFWVAVAVRPSSGIAYHNLGNAFRAQKQMPEAIDAYRKALQCDPTLPRSHHDLAMCLYAQKQLPEAIASYTTALKLEPGFAAGHYNLALAFWAHGQLPEAIESYRKAIKLSPNFVAAYIDLGGALLTHQQPTLAMAPLLKAIDLDRNNKKAWHNLYVAFRDERQLLEAGAALPRADGLDRQYAWIFNSLGNSLRLDKRPHEAIFAYRKAVELDPNLAAAHANLDPLFREMQARPDAIDAYRMLTKVAPDFAPGHYYLGLLLRGQGQLEDAVAEFRKVVAIDAKHAAGHDQLGWTLRLQGKLDEAVTACQRAVDLQPGEANFHNSLGYAFRNQGKLDEAIAEFRTALKHNAGFAPAVGNLAETERLVAMQKQLHALQKGEFTPRTAEELSAMAELCDIHKLHALKARLYADAVGNLPAEQREAWRKLWAAVAELLKRSE
jgi:tetratricopeptide (TPR) repeat protein